MGGSHLLTRRRQATACDFRTVRIWTRRSERRLVARSFPAAELVAEAMKTAAAIAAMPPRGHRDQEWSRRVRMRSHSIRFERLLFHGLFGTEIRRKDDSPSSINAPALEDISSSRAQLWSIVED